VNPFALVLVSLLAVSALPVSSGWAAAVWIGLMLVTTLVLRHGSRERASELSRAVLVSTSSQRRRDEADW
jgi:hypothetical protein